jgi:SAM-dependent methyltransferase
VCQIEASLSVRPQEWFANESYWIELYAFVFRPERFAAAADEVESVIRLTGIHTGRVLDLCCGPGRHSVEFAKRNFQVTGVDRSPFLRDKARSFAAEANLAVEFVLEDMRRFIRPAAFDLIINFFTSFGYFDDRAEDVAVLKLARQNLRPGGVLLIEMASKEWLAKSFQPTISVRLPDGALLVQRHEVVEDWARVKNEWSVIRDGHAVQTFEFYARVYSGQELKDALSSAGFRETKLYGALDGRVYGIDVKRLVAVARP